MVTIITDPRCTEYAQPGHPERPARIAETVARLRAQSELEVDWATPMESEDVSILRAHTASHLKSIDEPVADFDPDTVAHLNIGVHARRSVGGALRAMELGLKRKVAFSLLRPPGHHATADRAMGFCYLNSVAIAVLEARSRGVQRVAVFDFDVHHGNGTEAILKDRAGTAFYSVHQSPCYPGTGRANVGNNCFNFPVAPRTPRGAYRGVLERALDSLRDFKPGLIAVSAGFDAYAHDPLAEETLEAEDFYWLGGRIRATETPAFSLLEGGYSDDLPELVLAYLRGLDGR